MRKELVRTPPAANGGPCSYARRMIPDSVATFIDAEIAATSTDYSDLRAVFLNGTLKRSPEPSHTEGLLGNSRHILEGLGEPIDVVRLDRHDPARRLYPDMREHGWRSTTSPTSTAAIEPADIVVLATPIWLGDQS